MSIRNLFHQSPIPLLIFVAFFVALNVIYKLRISSVTIDNLPIKPLIQPRVNPLWTPMMKNNTKHCFIYSAYFDLRPFIKDLNPLVSSEGVVRIISVLPASSVLINKKEFQCHYKFQNGKLSSHDTVVVKQISEGHGARMSPFFILCPLQPNINDPKSVGVSLNKISKAKDIENSVNFIEIFHRRNVTRENKSIAVCPGPVFSSYDNALRIAEYIEIYKLQGATKFYFYDAGISENVMKLLKFYESQGTVEILSWNIATYVEINPVTIHHYGIIGCLNECFYHATLIDDFEYFIHADFDEEIFSYKTDTLKEFLEINDKAEIHSFVFSNYFFFFEFGHDLSNIPNNATNKFLYTQAQVTRMKKPFPYHTRCKYIAKKDCVQEIGNHFVWVGKGKELDVDVSIGALHHYRDNCTMFELCDTPREKNDYARKFDLRIWKAVDDVCLKTFSEDQKCPLGRNSTIDFLLQ